MNISWLLARSIKTRITAAALGAVLVCMGAMAVYVSALLQRDLQRVLGVQQFATATLEAADVDRDIRNRIKALESVAAGISPAMMDNLSALQDHLLQRRVFLALFNAGVVAYRPDGAAMAELPLETGRIGINYADRDYFLGALQGQPTIGKPHVSKSKSFQEFILSVPIRAPSGQVLGVLAGVTNLSRPNFLDEYVEQRYGKSGGYVLVDATHRLIITATDKTRVLEPLPAPGTDPALDTFLNGSVEPAVMRDSKGQEILAVYAAVPSTHWRLAVVLPTQEGFAPIQRLRERMLVSILMFTLLAGGLL